MRDLITIQPDDFSKQSMSVLQDTITENYNGEVIRDVGVCISLWEIMNASEGRIGHDTGAVRVKGIRTRQLLQGRDLAN